MERVQFQQEQVGTYQMVYLRCHLFFHVDAR